MFSSGTLRHDRVRLLLETPPYVNLVWAASATLPEMLRTELRDAFLTLSLDAPAQRPLLASLEASAFMPASMDDYEDLIALMKRLSIIDRPLETDRIPR
jgi:ABC-type phosphate/phosphonate transport system substrate-binding protein